MKSLLSKGISKENILLAAIWGAVIITGFLALGVIVGGIEGLFVFGRIHSFAVRLGLVSTAVHAFRHRTQIMSKFGIEIGSRKQFKKMGIESQSPKGNRAVKVVLAIVFHIVLHIISIHLTVAYTVLHIVQHRREIFLVFKKLSFRNNATRSHSLQPIQLVAQSKLNSTPLCKK